MDNCICSDYDEKGWSVCGFPCPEHNKMTKEQLKREMIQRNKELQQFRVDIKSGKIKVKELDFYDNYMEGEI